MQLKLYSMYTSQSYAHKEGGPISEWQMWLVGCQSEKTDEQPLQKNAEQTTSERWPSLQIPEYGENIAVCISAYTVE